MTFLLFKGQSQNGLADKHLVGKYSSTNNFYLEKPTKHNVTDHQDIIKYVFKLKSGDSLNYLRSEKAKSGLRHSVYSQFHNGIKIEGVNFIVHTNADEETISLTGSTVNQFTDNPIQVKSDDVINRVLAYFNIPFSTKCKPIEEYTLNSEEVFFSKPELIYYKLPDAATYSPEYKIDFISNDPKTNSRVFVNAFTSKIDHVENNSLACIPLEIPDLNDIIDQNSCNGNCNNASGNTTIYGLQGIKTKELMHNLHCQNILQDNCNGYTISTQHWDANASQYVEYYHNGNYYGDADEESAVTAHWCIEKTMSLYSTWFGLNSYNNANAAVTIYLDNGAGGNMEWNRTSNKILIQSGSSVDVDGKPPICIDAMAHEYTHGVTIHYTNIGNTGEQGAVNEAVSDIIGTFIEYQVKSNYNTGKAFSYLWGDEAFVAGNLFNCGSYSNANIRDVAYPKSTNHPDTYLGNYWINTSSSCGDGGKHNNATVIDYWFYLLSEGGGGTNDNGDDYCVKKVGMGIAADIVMGATVGYLSGYQNKDFSDFRSATLAYATDTWGPNSNTVAQITAAWFAVGVGSNFSGTVNIEYNDEYGIRDYHFNNAVQLNEYTEYPGAVVTVTSNEEIKFIPNDNFKSGAELNAYIEPACSGGARYASTNIPNNSGVSGANEISTAREVHSTNFIMCFPNPNNGNMSFKYHLNDNEIGEILITEITGKKINSVKLPQGSENYSFYDPSLQSGIYYYQFKVNGNTVKSDKIIISK
jgi:bacillolysin